jgi:hypothetical protein
MMIKRITMKNKKNRPIAGMVETIFGVVRIVQYEFHRNSENVKQRGVALPWIAKKLSH